MERAELAIRIQEFIGDYLEENESPCPFFAGMAAGTFPRQPKIPRITYDTRSGELGMEFNHPSVNGVPAEVWYGKVRRLSLPPFTSRRRLAENLTWFAEEAAAVLLGEEYDLSDALRCVLTADDVFLSAESVAEAYETMAREEGLEATMEEIRGVLKAENMCTDFEEVEELLKEALTLE